MANGGQVPAGRIQNEIVNNSRARSGNRDFAFGQFVAWDDYLTEAERIQVSLQRNDGKVVLATGQEIDINSVGGALALNIYLEVLDTKKESLLGLAKAGLKNENKLWSLQ